MRATGHISEPGLRVLMAAGGTGGHVYPAIAIADALRSQLDSVSVLFAGTKDRMEWVAVPKAGYPITPIWISGFHRRLTLRNLLFPLKVMVSLVQSLKLMIQFKPDLVIACGGFVSGPIGWAAARCGKRLMIQEQNSYPGVTNRMLAKDADLIFTAFEDAAAYFPAEKPVILTGNPIRQSMRVGDPAKGKKTYGLDPGKPCLLVLGGSGGAREINEALLRTLPELLGRLNLQVIWQCGPAYIESVQARLRTMLENGVFDGTLSDGTLSDGTEDFSHSSSDVSNVQVPGLHVSGYLKTIADAYSAADLVITRAGAGTCSELMVLGKAALLIPSPNVAGDHQTKNAQSMADEGAAVVLAEAELEDQLVSTIEELIQSPERLVKLASAAKVLAKPNAAHEIAWECLKRLQREDSGAAGAESHSGFEAGKHRPSATTGVHPHQPETKKQGGKQKQGLEQKEGPVPEQGPVQKPQSKPERGV